MGRIKTQLVKSATKDILEDNREKFSEDFEENKQALDEVAEIDSKKLRNVIAGNITRQMKSSK